MEHEDNYSILYPWPENHGAMHVCPNPECCTRNPDTQGPAGLMQANYFEEQPNSTDFYAQLFCGGCHTFLEGIFSADQIDEFDEVSDYQREGIHRSLKSHERENLTHDTARFTYDAVRFIGALHAGAIDPEDFKV